MYSPLRIDEIFNSIFGKFFNDQLLFGDFEILYALSKNIDLAVELGTARGMGAIVLSQNAKEVHTIDNFDVFDTGHEIKKINNEEEKERQFSIVSDYLNLWENITCKRANTHKEYKNYNDESIDLLFIDADHSLNGVRNDLELWFPKVRIGGHIVFHDYSACFLEIVRYIDEILSYREDLEEIKIPTLCNTVAKTFKRIK